MPGGLWDGARAPSKERLENQLQPTGAGRMIIFLFPLVGWRAVA